MVSNFKRGLLAAALVLSVPFSVQAACTLNDAAFNTQDGGCKDLATGLVWSIDSVKVQGFNNNYIGAVNYCANSTEGGQSDWRLPTKAEMTTVAANGAAAHLDYAYGANNLRWSSTAGTQNRIWTVRIGNGTSQQASKTSSLYEFCVRP